MKTARELTHQERIENILEKSNQIDEHEITEQAAFILDEMRVYTRDGLPAEIIDSCKYALDFAVKHLIAPRMRLVTDSPDAIEFALSITEALQDKAPIASYLRSRGERITAFIVDLWIAAAFELGVLRLRSVELEG